MSRRSNAGASLGKACAFRGAARRHSKGWDGHEDAGQRGRQSIGVWDAQMRLNREAAEAVLNRRIGALLNSDVPEHRASAHGARRAIADGLWSRAAELLHQADGLEARVGHGLPTPAAMANQARRQLGAEW